jgi:pimeloyl-ACP methyl ester carboxylesterase
VSPGSLLSLLEAMQDLDVTEDARSIRVPTLVIHRDGDRAFPPEAGRSLAALIPGAKYREHEGIDHAPMIGDGKRIVDEVLAFVETLSPAS